MDTTPDTTHPIEPTEAPMVEEETWADIPEDIMSLGTDEIMARTRLIDNDIKVCKPVVEEYEKKITL